MQPQLETGPSLPTEVMTAQGPVKMPLMTNLDEWGREFVRTWTRCQPETVAQWIKDGTLGQRAREAQEAMAEEISLLVEQGLTLHEAKHDATKKYLQPPETEAEMPQAEMPHTEK